MLLTEWSCYGEKNGMIVVDYMSELLGGLQQKKEELDAAKNHMEKCD